MNCPNCNVKIRITERVGDYCPQCGTFWIEKGYATAVEDRISMDVLLETISQGQDFLAGRRKKGGLNRLFDDHAVRDRKNRGSFH